MKPKNAVLLDRTVGRPVYKLHRALYRLTGGAIGKKYDGKPILLLTSIGRRSGEPRTNPLLSYRDGEGTDRPADYLVVASNGGRPETPAWLLNVQANPKVRVQVGRQQWAARAKVLSPEEKAQVWPRLTAYYAGWAHYETLTDREIPVVRLTPDS